MATSTLGSGTLVLAGTTSGTTTVTATAVAGTTTLTLPAATDTLVGRATTDTLTNKTLTGAAMNGTLGATIPSTGEFIKITTTSTANDWTNIVIGNTTSGQSYGTRIQAGTTAGDYSFLVKNATNATEYFSILGNGVAAFGGLVDISAATSGQIKFPATQNASSDANTLDDYEEGSHTTTANANTTLDNSYRAFKYTKVGNVVNVVGLLQITGSTGSTTLTFTLPFTAAADQTNGQNRSVGGCLPGNATTGTGGMVPFVQNNTAIMNLYKITLGVATNSTYAAATNADVINGSSINFNITYLTT